MIPTSSGSNRGNPEEPVQPTWLFITVDQTKEKRLRFLDRLGASARSPGTCFITGGGSALRLGWRETTINIDLKFDPEPAGIFDAIPGLKRAWRINDDV